MAPPEPCPLAGPDPDARRRIRDGAAPPAASSHRRRDRVARRPSGRRPDRGDGGLLAANALGDLTNRYVVARAGARVMNDLRLRLFEHLQHLSVGFYARAKVGDLMSRFTSDLDAIERFLTGEPPSTIYSSSRSASAPRSCAPSSGAGGVHPGARADVDVAQRIRHPPRTGRRDRQDALADVKTTLHENVEAEFAVKAFGLEAVTLARFRRDLERFAASPGEAGSSQFLAAAITGSSDLLLILSIAVGTYLVICGQLSVGSLTAFFELGRFIVWAGRAAVGRGQALSAGGRGPPSGPGLRRCPSTSSTRATRHPGATAPSIPFEDVDFTDGGPEPSLRRVTVEFRRDVGSPSWVRAGAGGPHAGPADALYDPTGGAVSIAWRRPRDGHAGQPPRAVGAAPGDFLFNTTIRTTSVWAGRTRRTTRSRRPLARRRSTAP